MDWYVVLHLPTQGCVGLVVVDGNVQACRFAPQVPEGIDTDGFNAYAQAIADKVERGGDWGEALLELRELRTPDWGVYLGGSWPRKRSAAEAADLLYDAVVTVPTPEEILTPEELAQALAGSDHRIRGRIATSEIPKVPTAEVPIWPFPQWGGGKE